MRPSYSSIMSCPSSPKWWIQPINVSPTVKVGYDTFLCSAQYTCLTMAMLISTALFLSTFNRLWEKMTTLKCFGHLNVVLFKLVLHCNTRTMCIREITHCKRQGVQTSTSFLRPRARLFKNEYVPTSWAFGYQRKYPTPTMCQSRSTLTSFYTLQGCRQRYAQLRSVKITRQSVTVSKSQL